MQGLIHALLMDGKGAAQQLDWQQAMAVSPEQGVLWIHLDYADSQAADWLVRDAGIDPLVAQALLDEDTRPRAHDYPGGVLLALRGVNLNPGEDPEDMVAIRLWLESGRIISTRKRQLLSIADIRASLLAGKGPRTPGGVMVTLSKLLIGRMSAVIDQIEEQTTELEELMLESTTVQARDQLSQLRRKIIALKRYLSPQREALEELQQMDAELFNDIDRMGLRESNDRLMRYIEDLNEARERAAVLHEETINRATDLMNQRMYVLSLVAAIFLPLGFLTGLLGINVGGIPGSDYPWAFLIFLVILTVTTAGIYWFFKVRRWL
ncbi:zinc transporter ZntB [Marinobacterium arenosum]|uniref:zinc transporter ZntB n=1 Tax=Marinobacterium arenosum TaxID=2862496 RepID=UPI001C94D899|nr:zinc transporter ZntB [Marinobacterium arenosum]MBY4678944.1 zinc transporter ZntB [Marinobacterium arenosum]